MSTTRHADGFEIITKQSPSLDEVVSYCSIAGVITTISVHPAFFQDEDHVKDILRHKDIDDIEWRIDRRLPDANSFSFDAHHFPIGGPDE